MLSNLVTFVSALIGLVLAVVFIFMQFFSSQQLEYDKDTYNSLSKWLKDTDDKEKTLHNKLKIIIADYDTTNEAIRRRDEVHLVVGTILVAASLFILGNTAESMGNKPIGIYSIASIGLFVIWLFVLHNTGKIVNRLAYSHTKAIEKALSDHFTMKENSDDKIQLEFGIHSFIVKKTNSQTDSWLRARRSFWGFVLFLLSLAWLVLSFY